MFTVILYWGTTLTATEGETDWQEQKLDLEDYDFLFSYAQMQNQMVKRKFSGDLKQTIEELHRDTGHLYDWKLILFDGRVTDAETAGPNDSIAPDTIRPEWNNLLLYLSGQKIKGIDIELEGFPPREIWYLSCWEKGTYAAGDSYEFAHAKLLLSEQEYQRLSAGCGAETTAQREDNENSPVNAGVSDVADAGSPMKWDALDVVHIPLLRMCWTEMVLGAGMQRRQEELRLCCILLILAYNDTPSSFLSSGYLYRINLEMDREQLARYVGQLHQLNLELGEQVQKAMGKYYRENQERVRYISHEIPNFYLPDAAKQSAGKKRHKVRCRDLSHKYDLELDSKLRDNHHWLNEQLYYFGSYLHQQVIKPAELEAQNRDVLLNAAGQADVQAGLENTIRSIHMKRQEMDSPITVEKGLWEKEKKVHHRIEERLDAWERRPTWGVLMAVEGFTFAVFGWWLVQLLWEKFGKLFPFYRWIVDASDIGRAVLNAAAFLISGVLIAALTLVVLCVFSFCNNINVCLQYNSYLKRTLRKQQKKQQNVIDLMTAIIYYQYYWALRNKQEEIRAEQTKEKVRLLHHRTVQKNATDVCRQLEQLLGKDERVAGKKMLLPTIDFTKEPEQVEYYWVPLRDRSRMRSLNNSGYEVDVIFDFVSEFGLYKTPAQIAVNE